MRSNIKGGPIFSNSLHPHAALMYHTSFITYLALCPAHLFMHCRRHVRHFPRHRRAPREAGGLRLTGRCTQCGGSCPATACPPGPACQSELAAAVRGSSGRRKRCCAAAVHRRGQGRRDTGAVRRAEGGLGGAPRGFSTWVCAVQGAATLHHSRPGLLDFPSARNNSWLLLPPLQPHLLTADCFVPRLSCPPVLCAAACLLQNFGLVKWRLKERSFFKAVCDALRGRGIFLESIW